MCPPLFPDMPLFRPSTLVQVDPTEAMACLMNATKAGLKSGQTQRDQPNRGRTTMSKNTTKTTSTKTAKAAATPAAATKVADFTPAQVREFWPASRAEYIVGLMKNDDLPYWRAVRRSRRHYLEGKWS